MFKNNSITIDNRKDLLSNEFTILEFAITDQSGYFEYGNLANGLKKPYRILDQLYNKSYIPNVVSYDKNEQTYTFLCVEPNGERFNIIVYPDNTYKKKIIEEEAKEFILNSSTPNSTKKFKITIDDNGTLSAEEVIE